jgi:hypothetical protein
MKIMQKIWRHSAVWTILAVIFFNLTACGGKFTKTTEADVGFFADNSIAMLRDANLGFSKGKALYTKEFYDWEAPELVGFDTSRNEADNVLKTMVAYSLKLVQIAEAEKTQSGRVEAYAAYIGNLSHRELAALQTNRDELKDLAAEIRSQQKFMDALKVAQPLIDSMGRYMSSELDKFDENLDKVVANTEKRIDSRYQLVIRYQEGLEKEKYSILETLGELYQAARGDAAAYQRAIASDAILKKSVIPGRRPTEENIETLFDYLVQRLNGLHRIQQEIEPDWKLYRTTQMELDELHALFKQEIRQIRVITIVWIRAHQKMASGRVKPAQWFDINAAPGTLIKMGTGLI